VQGLVDTVNSFMVRLEGALDALRHFTGNAGHQLRTPLAIVRTQLTLARRSGDLSEVQQAAEKADEAVGDAERILAQLLLMARIDAASRSTAMREVDLVDLARTVTAEHVPRAAEAGIDLGFEAEGEVTAIVEPILIGELVKNLVSNALLYAGAGAEVTVRVAGQQGGACVEVEDNGPGIPPDRRETVLRRFERGDVSGQGRPGTGLGLPIVEEIARLHSASLSLENGAGGKGLKVRIVFSVTA